MAYIYRYLIENFYRNRQFEFEVKIPLENVYNAKVKALSS